MRGIGEQETLVLWNPRRTDCRYITALAVWECEAALRRLKHCGARVAQGACHGIQSRRQRNAEVIDIDVYIPHTIRRNETLPPNRPPYIARDLMTMATVGGWLARLHDVEKKIKKTRAFGWKNRTEAGMVLSEAVEEKYVEHILYVRLRHFALCALHTQHAAECPLERSILRADDNTNDVSSNFLQKASASE